MHVAVFTSPPDPDTLVTTMPPPACDLGQRKPEAFEVWDVLHSGVGEVAAGHLPCAFEQVAGKRCEPDARPIVAGPPERRENRCHEQRRIGHPPGDDDVGASMERFDDGIGSEIRIRRHDRTGIEWFVRLDGAIWPVRHHRRDVVAGHDGDGHIRQTGSSGHVTHAAGGGMRIRGSHVGDQRHAAPVARRKHSLHAFAKKGIEAGRGSRAFACCASAIVRSARHSKTR